MNQSSNNTKEIPDVHVEYPDQSPIPRFLLQDYWVDFLGGLLPGTLVSVGAVVSIFPSIWLLLNSLSLNFQSSLVEIFKSFFVSIRETPSMIWVGIGTILFSLFYVLGHMFYRQDPKIPNQHSFTRLKKELEAENEGKGKSKEDLDDLLKCELACKNKEECEFPYPYFDKYLTHRGLNHLHEFVVWSEKPTHRTKNYINILKIRLRFHFPNRCGTIIRNEAHVRLASSTWYAAGALFKFSKVAISITVISYLIYLAVIFFELSIDAGNRIFVVTSQHLGVVIVAMLIYVLAEYAREQVEKFLHYQRMREVVHVMETAWTAFRKYPQVLRPPFKLKLSKERK